MPRRWEVPQTDMDVLSFEERRFWNRREKLNLTSSVFFHFSFFCPFNCKSGRPCIQRNGRPVTWFTMSRSPPLYARTGIPSKNLKEQREQKSQRPLTEHSIHLWRINTKRLSHSKNLTSPDSPLTLPQMYQHQIFIFLWVPGEWRTWMRESKKNRESFKERLWKACRERPAS